MSKVTEDKKAAKKPKTRERREERIKPRLKIDPWKRSYKKKMEQLKKEAELKAQLLKAAENNEGKVKPSTSHDNENLRNDCEEEENEASPSALNNTSSAADMSSGEAGNSDNADSSDYQPDEDDDEDWEKANKKPTIKKKPKMPALWSRTKEKEWNLPSKRLPKLPLKNVKSGKGEISASQEEEVDEANLSPYESFMRRLIQRSDIGNENKDHEESAEASQAREDDKLIADMIGKSQRRRWTRKRSHWSDQELKDLALGLQTEGFSDLNKVAEHVKTKNANAINAYLIKYCQAARKAELAKKQPDKHRSRWTTVTPENIATWTNIRKWRKLSFNQMLPLVRRKDYSKPVISALCRKFYEEEPEPSDPQVINVKMIYKYMMDCMSGEIPAQLPPKESALVLDMLREERMLPIFHDFEEELKFLHDFKDATKFVPFQVKDEFTKRFKKVNDETLGPNTVRVCEEVFMDLSRHKKLIQSFSPLVAPVWMVTKEQEIAQQHNNDLNVYIDD